MNVPGKGSAPIVRKGTIRDIRARSGSAAIIIARSRNQDAAWQHRAHDVEHTTSGDGLQRRRHESALPDVTTERPLPVEYPYVDPRVKPAPSIERSAMILLHAAFIRNSLLIWGETSAAELPVVQRRRGRPPKHPRPDPFPFDAGADRLRSALSAASLLDDPSIGDAITAYIHLPRRSGIPIPSSPLIAELPESPDGIEIGQYTVAAVALTPIQAAGMLSRCIDAELLTPGVIAGSTLRFWAEAFRLAARLAIRQRFLPDIDREEDGIHARWKPVIAGDDIRLFETLTAVMPGACRAITLDVALVPETAGRTVLNEFIAAIVDALVRSAWVQVDSPPPSRRGRHSRARRRVEETRTFDSLHDRWTAALGTDDGAMAGTPIGVELLGEAIAAWQRSLRVAIDSPFRLCFRLEEPASADGAAESITAPDAWRVRYLLRPERDPSLLVDVADLWRPRSRAATLLKRHGGNAREYLLAALGQASKLSPDIEQSLRDAVPAGFTLDLHGAHRFLTEQAWLLEQAGFVVLLPAWWTRKGTKGHLVARAAVSTPRLRASAGLTLDTVVEVDWTIALGDRTLTLRDLEDLARLKAPLVNLRGEWVQLNADEIEQAVRFWKKKGSDQRTLESVMRLALGAEETPGGLEISGVDAGGAVQILLEQLEGKRSLAPIEVPEGFHGTLRPYQRQGFAWLEFMSGIGLGACLADDMGLGKTIQTLALLELDRQAGHSGATLLVCPTSVTENWRREAQRFTPDLPVMVHHGAQRAKGKQFAKEVAGHSLVVTSYALLHRDIETLRQVDWSGVVLDEAQNIKNPGTRQARAARALQSGYRIALTGTPVENHVGDLWSIMEFLNPGFLGSETAFKRRFLLPIQIERDPEAIDQLRRLTTPFILRRVKTDTSIIADLPEKQEMKVFCTLTREQASLYAAVVNDATIELAAMEGIQRRGLVLATLTKLKQICNHPAQFLGDNSTIGARSGKLARLTEMLEEVLAAGDRALVFTQFAEMGGLLKRHLQESFGIETLFLYGGTPKKERDRMVERFQEEQGGPRIFVLSLKAGGTGLNLTAANHVFHFDRWWNPAVENQATDRAFRIGQQRNVQVHKFLCAGTVEERIDEMIEMKQELAASIVGSGEGWLTELSTTELKQLLELREEAVGE